MRLGWRREKGTEMDRLTKTASTRPRLPSTHMGPLPQKNPPVVGLEGGREGGGEVIYVQLGYIVKVRASGRGKNDF